MNDTAPLPTAFTTPDGIPWAKSLRRALRSWKQVVEFLRIGGEETGAPSGQRAQESPGGSLAESDFPVFATREYLARIDRADPRDPLLLQIQPTAAEMDRVSGFIHDPVGDMSAQVVPGLLHKYSGRVLLIATGACAVHCRYCFRRHFPYAQVPKGPKDWEEALEYIRQDASIQEVILSGGDPLTLTDGKLAWLVQRLDGIAHLKRLRIHTRLPVMIPSRVCGPMLDWLKATRLSRWLVLHANHARELDHEVQRALQRLRDAHVNLLNQSVLLAGINDSVDALESLSQRLLEIGVLPYYLHQLDPVEGAAHFQVAIQDGLRLMEQLRERLPGYAIPRYVAEYAGQPSKTELAGSV